MSDWIGNMRDAMGERELLYTMNGKPVYRDEMRPIGESSSSIRWDQVFYGVCMVIGALITFWANYLR